MKPCPYSLDRVLPHAHPMILIDEIIGYGVTSLTSVVTVQPSAQFFRQGRGIPSHIGLEWMAQTCGAFAGAQALDAGGRVRTGLLLGTRDFSSSIAWFEEGRRVEVVATQLFNDGQIGSFECAIMDKTHTEPLATATLTVYQLEDGGALASATRSGAGT